MMNKFFSFLFILTAFLSGEAFFAKSLSQVCGAVALPAHDMDGNMVSAGAGVGYEYDSENRLVGVVVGDVEVSYVYDSDGRCVRREQKVGGVVESTVESVYEGMRVVEEKHYDGSGALQSHRHYLWGYAPGDVGGLLGVKEKAGGHAGVYHYLYDGNGNVAGMLDGNGAEVARYRYDAFGRVSEVSGLLSGWNAIRYSTKPQDGVSGLYNYGYRWYESTTGRWLNRDPLEEGGGFNLYGFCNNAAFNYIEYYGGSFLDYIPSWGDIQDAYGELPAVLKAPLVVASYPVKVGGRIGSGLGRIAGDIGGIGLAGWDNGVDGALASAGVVGAAGFRDLVGKPYEGLEGLVGGMKDLWEDPCARERLLDWLKGLPGRMGERWMDAPLTMADDIAELAALTAEGLLLNAAWPRASAAPAAESAVARAASSADDLAAAAKKAAAETLAPAAENAGTRLLNAGLTIEKGNAKFGLEHILRRHSFNTGAENVSRFSRGMGHHEIKALIQEAGQSGAAFTAQGSKRVLNVNMGRVVGTDQAGNAVTGLRVVTDANGSVITAYPIGFP